MNLLKELSSLKLPAIDCFWLDHIPDDSDHVRAFMKNSISSQSRFFFNNQKQVQVEFSKYAISLIETAKKTSEQIGICYTDFKSNEFWDLVSASKQAKILQFYSWKIPLEEEGSFSNGMEDWKINSISFISIGGSSWSYFNWVEHPNQFENLIATFSKCSPLMKSLSTITIGRDEILIEKAKEILEKYKMNEIELKEV